MLRYELNSEYRYVGSRGTDRGYVISRWGQQSIVNVHALELLTDTDADWQGDPEYREFLETAQAARWLVPASERHGTAHVRWVDRQYHLRRVQYEINLLCNLTCLHCYCSSSPRAPAGRSTEFVLELVRQAGELGVIHFDITGGEPLVRKDIVEVTHAVTRAGMVPGLLSNCTLATPELAAELVNAGLASVQASLDGCTAEVHDGIRGQAGAFKRALNGIAAFRAAGVEPRISVTLNRLNVHQASDMARFFGEELGLRFNFDRVIPAGRSLEQRAQPLELSNAEFYAVIRDCAGASTSKVCDSATQITSNGHVEPGCGVGASYVFIKQDGRVALCPTMTEAESPAFAQASLDEMSLAEAWESHPTFQRFRNMQCENASHCSSGKTCRGGCRSNAYLLHGDVSSPDEMSCNLNKNDASDYRPFLKEYEELRARGVFPARSADSVRAPRRLPVLG